MTVSTTRLSILLAAIVIGLCGCTTVNPAERFPDVQRDVQLRLDKRVLWQQFPPTTEDEHVEQAIAETLSRPLSADDSVQIALFRNPDLQVTFEDLGIAQADVVQAGQLRNPEIAGFFRFPDSPPSAVNWNIGVDIWLLDAFLVPIRKQLAGADEELAIQRVTTQVLRLAAETRAAYYAHQADASAARAQEEIEELARLANDLAERQNGAGNVDDLGLAADKAAYQQAHLALIQARSAERASLERLRQLLGLTEVPVNWSLAQEVSMPTAGEPNEEELLSLALTSRLDLTAALVEVQRQEYALELSKQWWLSTVQIGIETERSTDRQFTTGPHFSTELPIFNQRQGEIARQEAIIRQVRHRAASLQQQVRTEVRTSLDRVTAARQVVELYRDEILPLRRKVFDAMQDRYNSMFVGVFELLDAKAELTAAQTASARALQDYWTARSDLELALGTQVPDAPLPPPQEPAPDAVPELMPDMPGMDKPESPQPANPTMPDMPGMPGMSKPAPQPTEPSHQQHQPR